MALKKRLQTSLKPKPKPQGFDFTSRMRVLCEDIAIRVPEMQHLDVSRIAIAFAQTRKRVRHGMWASLTPMRFEDGAEIEVRNGRRHSVQRLYAPNGTEMLYILTFYLPRFMQLSFQDKLVTVFHELWHISPNFDGDIRRFPGRCFAHSDSEEEYDALMEVFAKRWLRAEPPEEKYSFLKLKFSGLQQRYGQVYGVKVPQPKIIPIE